MSQMSKSMFTEQDSIEVENIIGHRAPQDRRRKNIQYQVLWKGYKQDQTTWETFENLKNCQDLLRKYHQMHPELLNPFRNKPKPNDDDYHPERPLNRKIGPKRPRGRPPKNFIQKLYKGPQQSQAKRQQTYDGFNVRMQTQQKSLVSSRQGQQVIKVTKVYAHPDTNQIFYEVKQYGQVSLKPRKWVLSRSKQALILFYESLMVIHNQ